MRGQCLVHGTRRRVGVCALGRLIGKVRAPEMVANLAWGGPDFQTLFMRATHSVYSVKTKVGPRREPYMSPRSGGPGAQLQLRDAPPVSPSAGSSAATASRTARA